MTVAQLKATLAEMPDELEVVFAHCRHWGLSVDAVENAGDDLIVELISHGWTDDCKCPDDE
jgi:hypothetical protein